MNFLNTWLQGIIVAVVIATIIDMIMPNGNSRKYVKVVLGIYVVFNIIAPIVNKFAGKDLKVSSLTNIEDAFKEMDTYNTSSSNINISKSNEENIKQIYIANLKQDIKAKLEGKNYDIERVNITLENSENYELKEIEVYINGKKEKKDNNNVSINQIEKINIQVERNEENVKNDEKPQFNKIPESKQKEIKQYLSGIYEINEENIHIN